MVFISYSHDSDDFCDKVLGLSNYLRSQGIDSNIDQYEESPPEGWPRWMESQIRTAEYVLVVCTKNYSDKAILETHSDTGLGVKWETNLILNQLYQTGAVTTKFIPVVFSNTDVESIIEPLKGHTYYNLSYDIQKEKLRNRLKNIKATIKPPIGTFTPVEEKIAKPDARSLITSVIDLETWDKAGWKGVGYMFDFKESPYIGIWHTDLNASLKIFSDWINRFGNEDKNDEIYLSIIEEDDSSSYSIHIGSNIIAVDKRLKESGIKEKFDYYINIDRWHRMTDVDKKYLETFKQEYLKHKEFYILPMKKNNEQIEPIMDLKIKKHKIRFVKESELTDTDYDYLAVKLREESET